MKAKWSFLLNLAFYTCHEIESLFRQKYRSIGPEKVKWNRIWIVLSSWHSLSFKKDTHISFFLHYYHWPLIKRSFWALFAEDFHIVPTWLIYWRWEGSAFIRQILASVFVYVLMQFSVSRPLSIVIVSVSDFEGGQKQLTRFWNSEMLVCPWDCWVVVTASQIKRMQMGQWKHHGQKSTGQAERWVRLPPL